MDRAAELAQIEAFLAARGATRCPPADADSIDLTRLTSNERRRAAMSRWPHKATGRKRGPRPGLRPRIEEELARDPNRTCAAIAAVVGCSAMTVSLTRRSLARQQNEEER